MISDPVLARRLWSLFEPVHAVGYFTEPPRAAFGAVGLRGFWRGYFAGRAAPLGPVGAVAVTSAMFSFAPHTVARAIPEVWSMAGLDDVLRARREGSAAALRELLPEAVTAGIRVLLPLLQVAVAAADVGGRPLAAANLAVALPDDPVERLWQLCTTLREHRGDGHLAAVVCRDLDGCEILVLRAGIDLDRGRLQQARGWTDDEWVSAEGRLVDRGLVAPGGRATEIGIECHAGMEADTDAAAIRPWLALGPDDTAVVEAGLSAIAEHVTPVLPADNPIGLPVRH